MVRVHATAAAAEWTGHRHVLAQAEGLAMAGGACVRVCVCAGVRVCVWVCVVEGRVVRVPCRARRLRVRLPVQLCAVHLAASDNPKNLNLNPKHLNPNPKLN